MIPMIIINHHHRMHNVSVCQSVTGGQWKRFDLKTQDAVSLAIEHFNLAVGMNTSFLGRLYKNQATMDTCIKWYLVG